MHEKLSQAVKLYDQLLSEQVAHPRWRTTSTAYNTFGYQPQQAYPAAAVSPNGYGQWSGPQVSPSPYQAPSEVASGSQVSHMSSPLHATHPDSQPQHYQQQVLQQQPMMATNVPVSIPAPIQSPSYSLPTNSTSHAIQHNQAMQLSPAIPQSPPPAPPASQYPLRSPPAPSFQPPSSLARHNTVNYRSLPSGPAPSSPHLARSSTVAYSVSQRPLHHVHPQQQQQQQQPAQHVAVSPLPAAPTNLPQFPSVPTSAPQPTYSMYGSSLPFKPNEERKEALLIDL